MVFDECFLIIIYLSYINVCFNFYIYGIYLWDIYLVLIWRLSARNITSENNYNLRDRVSNFWIGKFPDFRSFYRKEISILERLNNLLY